MPHLSHSLATSLITPRTLSFSLMNPSSFADHIVMRSGTILRLMLGVAVANYAYSFWMFQPAGDPAEGHRLTRLYPKSICPRNSF